MITSSKEIMKRIIQSAFDKEEITPEEYKRLADELGIITCTASTRGVRLDIKSGKILESAAISIDVVDETVFLYINNGRIKKVWRMPIENWDTLTHPVAVTEKED